MAQPSGPKAPAVEAAAAFGEVAAFAVEVHQNEYLAAGAREVEAIVTVTATGTARRAAGAGPDTAVVIMLDRSRSAAHPPAGMDGARAAIAAALDTLPDGAAFAVVAGTHRAVEVYPGGGRLAAAAPATRAAAKAALDGLAPGGGTAIGGLLRLAEALLSGAGRAIRHAVLVTDGRDEPGEPGELAKALDRCAGRFTCDCRGVGTDGDITELARIAGMLHSTADIIADPGRLADDLRTVVSGALAKEVAGVGLRLWTPRGAAVRFVRQVAPSVTDLTGRRGGVAERVGDYPTGSWGAESRDYHIGVEVPPAGVGQEMLAARVAVALPSPGGGPERIRGQGLIRAVWTDDPAAAGRISPHVAHYTGQTELTRAIRQGLAARRAGDRDTATARLGHAVRLAAAAGDEATARLLATVVDVVEEATGTVRLRQRVTDEDEMTLATRATRTVRVRRR